MQYLNILCWIIFLPLLGYSQDTVISDQDALDMAMQNNPELNRPLASVVIGGLITATLLTLLVLPTLYHWLEKNRKLPAPTDSNTFFNSKQENEHPQIKHGDEL